MSLFVTVGCSGGYGGGFFFFFFFLGFWKKYGIA